MIRALLRRFAPGRVLRLPASGFIIARFGSLSTIWGRLKSLHVKKIGMGAGALEDENQLRLCDAVDQQPIRANVTFPMRAFISDQLVIMVLGRKGLTGQQHVDDCFKQRYVIASFF